MKNLKAAPMALSMMMSLNSFLIPATAEGRDTPNYDRCTSRESGEWNYGRAPEVCRANAFGDDNFVKQQFDVTVFRDTLARDTERKRYITEMNALIREAARAYLKKKKPYATEAELTHWTLGVLATAAHESRMSHYRSSSKDGFLKLMRGDYGHGHGMMQIDDRAHYPAITQGIAWNLASSLTYAMDIYYKSWQDAPSASCVGSATNWIPRIRAAWSVYNGGGGTKKLCRWTNPKDAWAKNDQNFYAFLSGRTWEKLVTNANHKTRIPIDCLMEKRENCSPTSPTPADPGRLVEGQLYRLQDGFCVAHNGALRCLDDERDRQCLREIRALSSGAAVELTAAQAAALPRDNEDRHDLCSRYDRGLIAVGSGIQLLKNINLRVTPGGGLQTVIPAGTKLQVRDFELRNDIKDRYYRVLFNGFEGYVYAGDASTAASWGVEIPSRETARSNLARLGDKVVVTNAAGINLRATPGGTLLGNVPKGTVIGVLGLAARTTDNKIYYQVKHGTKTGYIYTGSILPVDSLSSWSVPQK